MKKAVDHTTLSPEEITALEEKAAEKMSIAKVKAVMTYPFLASILLRLENAVEWGVPTMATDSVRLFYNPSFVCEQTDLENTAVCYHEAMHVVLQHPFRRYGRDYKLWNIACDHAVNIILTDDKIAMPDGALLDSAYRGMNADEIYAALLKTTPQQKKSMVSGMFGESWDYNKGGPINPNSNNQQQPQGQGGTVRGYELSPDLQAEEWKGKIAAAMMAGKMAGKMPAGLDRFLDKLMNPQLPWKEILARFITERARDDFSWQKPNKRYLYGGLYLPFMDSPAIKKIGVLVDTSGSIGDDQIRAFASEILGVLSSVPTSSAEIVYVDADVAGHQELTADTIHELKAKGGGGTDFRPGFKYFEDKQEDLACVIYFTDGYCNSFPKKSEYETLWIIHGDLKTFKPPFGEVAFMEST